MPAGNLAVSGESNFTDASGTLADNGAMSLNNSTFNQSGGVESGGTVALSNSSTLADSAGAGAFSFVNTDTLSGTVPAGQTVTVLGVPSVNSVASLSSPGVTNDGTFVLDSQASGGYADVNGSPLTNNGSFETVGATSQPDYIEANLTNDSGAVVTISGATTRQDEATTTVNNGSFTVEAAGALLLTGAAAFTDSGGTLVDTGTMTVSGSTFTQSGGVESGGTVALSNSSTLADGAGGGAFSFENTDTLSGTIPAGQTVSVLGVPSVNSYATLASPGVTNDGTFVLDSQTSGGFAGVEGSPMTNNATFETVGATSQPDYIEANLTNDSGGVVTISGATTRQDEATTTTNDGTFAVADGGKIALTGRAVYTQVSTGTYSATIDATNGAFGMTGGTDTLAGTLAINTVGSPTLGNTYNLISGATSVTGAFATLSFGPDAYVIGYNATSVTATVATPFALTGKNPSLTEHIPNATIKVATGVKGSQAGPVYTATINGDGSQPTNGKVKISGADFSVTGSHVYDTPGPHADHRCQRPVRYHQDGHVPCDGRARPGSDGNRGQPLELRPGVSDRKLTITGTGLTDNTVVTFSNPGVTLKSFTWKSSTTVTVSVNVAVHAATGAGNVTVTTPGGSASCTGCLTIDASPQVTSVSPPLVAGSATTVTVSGSGFQAGLTVTTSISGATVGAPSAVTSGSFQVTITVPVGTASGDTYNLTVANPDGGKVTYKHLAVS